MYVSSGNKLDVYFHSDSSGTDRGIRASYRQGNLYCFQQKKYGCNAESRTTPINSLPTNKMQQHKIVISEGIQPHYLHQLYWGVNSRIG